MRAAGMVQRTRVVVDDVTGLLAQRTREAPASVIESRRLRGTRATKGAEGERLARGSSRVDQFEDFSNSSLYRMKPAWR